MSSHGRRLRWSSLRICLLVVAFAVRAFAQTEAVITSIVPPPDRVFQQGQQIDFLVRFNIPVVVVPPASIRFVMGSGTVTLNYYEGSGSTTLRFSVNVGSDYNDYDGVDLVGPIVASNGGSIRDLAGRNANLNFATYHAAGVRIDTAPFVTTIWLQDPTTGFSRQSRVVYRVFFNEPVFNVTPAAFALTVTTGLRARVASVSANTGTVFDVAVETEGEGPVRLDFPPNTEVRDAFGTRAAAYGANGPTYTIQLGPVLFGTTVRATAGQSFAYTFSAEGGATRYDAVNLPPGLALNAATGVVNGVPTVAGRYLVEVTSTRDSRAAMTTFIFEVAGPGAPPTSPADGRTAQFLWLRAPTTGLRVGEVFTLNGNATSGLPVSYSVTAGDALLTATTLTPRSGRTLVVRVTQAGNATYAPESIDVNFGNPERVAQTIEFAALADRPPTDSAIPLVARASSGLAITYIVTGPAIVDGPTLRLTGAPGEVTVRAQQAGNDTYLPATDVVRTFHVIEPVARLINLSSRTGLGPGPDGGGLIAGFVIAGTGPRTLLVRGVGPTLAQLGVSGVAASPRVQLRSGAGALIAANEGWLGSDEIAAAGARSGAFALGPTSRDAAMLLTLSPGPYTAQLSAADGSGIGLLELYDATLAGTPGAAELVNLSARGFVGAGDAVLIAGFGLTGGRPRRVLVRGVGPGLRAFGVGDALADPSVRIFQGSVLVAQNDNWETGQTTPGSGSVAPVTDVVRSSAAAGAFALVSGSLDAALVVELPAGSYTVVLAGASAGQGTGLIEVYRVE